MRILNCDPDKNKALCCRGKEGTVFELEVFFEELSMFDPRKVVITVTPYYIYKSTIEKLPFSIRSLKFFKKAMVDLEKIGFPDCLVFYSIRLFFLDNQCYLLDNNKCSIYNNRPFICRAYPFVTGDKLVFKDPFYKCRQCCSTCVPFKENEIKKMQRKLQEHLRRRYSIVMKRHKEVMEQIIEYIINETSIGKHFVEDIDKYKFVQKNSEVAINIPMTLAVMELAFGRDALEHQKKALLLLIEKLNGNKLFFGMKKYLNVLEKFL